MADQCRLILCLCHLPYQIPWCCLPSLHAGFLIYWRLQVCHTACTQAGSNRALSALLANCVVPEPTLLSRPLVFCSELQGCHTSPQGGNIGECQELIQGHANFLKKVLQMGNLKNLHSFTG